MTKRLLSFALPGLLASATLLCGQSGRPDFSRGGWKQLIQSKDFSAWHGRGNKPGEWFTTNAVSYQPSVHPKTLAAIPGAGTVIVNGPTGRTVDLVTKDKFGDVELYVEFVVPATSNSGVYLHGLYEVQVLDSWGVEKPGVHDCGAIYERWINGKGVGGSAPMKNASRPPGKWQSFHIWFRAPRFDAQGRKTANARFLKVLHNGVLVQQNVDVDGPTRASLDIPEAAENPLMLQGDHGPVAYREIYIRPLPAGSR